MLQNADMGKDGQTRRLHNKFADGLGGCPPTGAFWLGGSLSKARPPGLVGQGDPVITRKIFPFQKQRRRSKVADGGGQAPKAESCGAFELSMRPTIVTTSQCLNCLVVICMHHLLGGRIISLGLRTNQNLSAHRPGVPSGDFRTRTCVRCGWRTGPGSKPTKICVICG